MESSSFWNAFNHNNTYSELHTFILFEKKKLKSSSFLQLQGFQCYYTVTLQGNVNIGKGSFKRMQFD